MTRHLAPGLAAFALFLLSVRAFPADPAPTSAPPAEPPAPQPSAAVQALLRDAAPRAGTSDPSETLRLLDRAVQTATDAHDAPGEAQAGAARAQALEQAGRFPEAVTAWRATAAAWERAGDGPNQIA